MTLLSAQFESGRLAAHMGWDAANCPHEENTDANREWLRGWLFGVRELREGRAAA